MKRTWIITASAAALVVLVCAIGAGYVLLRFGTVSMQSAAMEPTIHKGTTLLVDRFAYRAAPPKRGDVIAYGGMMPFSSPLVHRVMAVPGDRFAIQQGRALLNGRPVLGAQATRTKYELSVTDYDIVVDGKRLGEPGVLTVSDWTSPGTVPPGCYIVLGDNRSNSVDSHVFGFLCPNRNGLMSLDEPARLIGRIVQR